MLSKIFSAIAGFTFIGLAAMIGVAFSTDKFNLISTALTILFFVASTSFLLGVVFGPSTLRVMVVSGCSALFILWLPLQMYATEKSLINSAGILLFLFVILGICEKLGSRMHQRVFAPALSHPK